MPVSVPTPDQVIELADEMGLDLTDADVESYIGIFEAQVNDYNIVDFQNFNSNDDLKDGNIAATLLKIQERKTAKGNAYAVLKLTDFGCLFSISSSIQSAPVFILAPASRKFLNTSSKIFGSVSFKVIFPLVATAAAK